MRIKDESVNADRKRVIEGVQIVMWFYGYGYVCVCSNFWETKGGN